MIQESDRESCGVAVSGRIRLLKTWWDGGNVANTLTTRSLFQYMPDKDNFAAAVVRRVIMER